jgi:hypothetical protein
MSKIFRTDPTEAPKPELRRTAGETRRPRCFRGVRVLLRNLVVQTNLPWILHSVIRRLSSRVYRSQTHPHYYVAGRVGQERGTRQLCTSMDAGR